MLNKLASSFILASALVGTMMAPSYADGTFQSICLFPVKVVGAGVGTVLGVPLGAYKDCAKGFGKAEGSVAGICGNQDGQAQKVIGCVVGGPVGFIGGAAYGALLRWTDARFEEGFLGAVLKDSMTFKDE